MVKKFNGQFFSSERDPSANMLRAYFLLTNFGSFLFWVNIAASLMVGRTLLFYDLKFKLALVDPNLTHRIILLEQLI